jgi:hypothetical protein
MTWRNSFGLTGFVRWAATPNSRLRAGSPGWLEDVSMRIGAPV